MPEISVRHLHIPHSDAQMSIFITYNTNKKPLMCELRVLRLNQLKSHTLSTVKPIDELSLSSSRYVCFGWVCVYVSLCA